MLRGVSPRASPTVTGGAVEPGHHTAVCGGSGSAAGRTGSVRVCTARCRCLQPSLCATTCPSGAGAGAGADGEAGSRSAADRGPTPPWGRGAVGPWAGGAPGAPLPPVPGSGGGPAAVRTAFSSPSPSPLSSLGVRALCAACSAERGPAAERPLRRLSLPGDGRSPRHPRPPASSTGLLAACGATSPTAIALLSGGPRRGTGRAGRAPPRGAVPVSPAAGGAGRTRRGAAAGAPRAADPAPAMRQRRAERRGCTAAASRASGVRAA